MVAAADPDDRERVALRRGPLTRDKIFAVGGVSCFHPTNGVEYFNEEENKWYQVTGMSEGRMDHYALVVCGVPNANLLQYILFLFE
jgi:hypothetical protein